MKAMALFLAIVLAFVTLLVFSAPSTQDALNHCTITSSSETMNVKRCDNETTYISK